MTNQPLFHGAATALITPLNEKGVDFDAMGRLIDWQIAQGIDALVIVGTTGEKSTLNDTEHRAVLQFAAERIAGRVPMIAGTGSNDTAYSLSMCRHACDIGADALLVVTPYYNKATQKGLIKMYTTLADASTKPLILYNVPSRTGVNLEPETISVLADHPNICGLKAASGNISKIVETAALTREKDFDIWSGNDDQIVPILSMGGAGVVSVLSNVLPKETSRLCHRFFEGDIAGAAEDQCRYLNLVRALFSEVNPIPVKAAMSMLGWCEDYLRMPLTTMEPQHREVLKREMEALGIL